MPSAERLREVWGVSPLTVTTDDGEIEVESVEYLIDEEPEELDPEGWDEGCIYIDGYCDKPPEAWSVGYCGLDCRTRDGEWGGVRLKWCEDWSEGDDHPTESFDSETVVQSLRPGVRWAGPYRERASEARSGVRAKSLERLVLAVEVVRAASTGRGDVWESYLDADEEPSLAGFTSWLDTPRLRRLLTVDVGRDVFPGERDGLLDCGDRVIDDLRNILEYRFSEDSIDEVVVDAGSDGSSGDDEDDDGDEQDDDDVPEVTFEPSEGM